MSERKRNRAIKKRSSLQGFHLKAQNNQFQSLFNVLENMNAGLSASSVVLFGLHTRFCTLTQVCSCLYLGFLLFSTVKDKPPELWVA